MQIFFWLALVWFLDRPKKLHFLQKTANFINIFEKLFFSSIIGPLTIGLSLRKRQKKVSNTPEDDDWIAATILIMKQIAKTMILIHREQNKADR